VGLKKAHFAELGHFFCFKTIYLAMFTVFFWRKITWCYTNSYFQTFL